MLKSLIKYFPLFILLLISSNCFCNDTILIRNTKILDIQFENDRLQIKDLDGSYEYLKYAWTPVPEFPKPIQCSFQETFNEAAIVDSLNTLEKEYFAIGNTLIEGCQDFQLVNSFPSKISCLSSYNSKEFLVGTLGDGIYVCQGSQKQKLYIPNLSLPETILQLEQIGDDIIMNTGNNISSFNATSFLVSQIYNSKQSLKMETDNLQNLWIVDGNKLVCNSQLYNPNLNECKIQSFGANSDKITSESNIDVSYFTYYPKNQSEVEYSYRLDEENWLATENESVRFSNLSPGQHRFEVRSTVDGQTYSLPAVKSFRVESTLKDSIWPLILGFTSLLVLGFILALWKQNNDTKELSRSRDKLQLENELLKSKQKVLELQMNPHFLFNTLNSIQGLIALKKNKEARQYLKEFSQMMRSILQSSREENITVADEIKFLKNYMSLEQMARNNAFDFEVVIDKNLDLEKRIPVMILQALLENSILHGVAPMHGTGHIVLKLEEQNGKLHCTVTDNGVGMDTGKKDVQGHKSYAGDIIKERLKKYNIKEVVYKVPESGKGVIAEVVLPFL